MRRLERVIHRLEAVKGQLYASYDTAADTATQQEIMQDIREVDEALERCRGRKPPPEH